MSVFLFSISYVAMISALFVDAISLNSFQDHSHFRVDNEDCSRFYIRRNGKEIQMKCQDDHVVNTNTRSCVPKGSFPDKCKCNKIIHDAVYYLWKKFKTTKAILMKLIYQTLSTNKE